MVTYRRPTRTFVARSGEFYIGRYPDTAFTSAVSISGTFSAATTYAVEGAAKNITVTPPETAWEKLDLLGEDANTFQNAVLDEKPVGLATVSATLVLGEDETIEDQLVSGTVTGASGYTRYQIGSAASSNTRLTVAVTLISSDASKQVSFGLQDARVTKWGDVKVGGADGHWEQDISLVCLAKNFYYEFKN